MVVWQFASDRQETVQATSAQIEQTAREQAPPSLGEDAVSPSSYLRPEAAVVSFWPRPELDLLRGWLASDRPADVALVTGQAGAGKTRLALRLADQARQEFGWHRYWVPAGGEDEAVQAARQGDRPALIVCDYAETRADLSGLLAQALKNDGGPSVRVLMLARAAGEWWQQVVTECDVVTSDILAAVQPVTLGPLAGPTDQEEVFGQALAAFADRLGVEVPPARLPRATADAVALVVHAAALLAVLDAETPAPDPTTNAAHGAEQVIGGLLRHEARYWEHSQRRYGLDLGPTLTGRVVAAGTLVGADAEESAVTLLAAIGDLADPALRGKAARWLHDLYPTADADEGQAEWIGPLRPDLVAETLIVRALSGQPALTKSLLRGLTPTRASHVLTVLARAALTSPVGLSLLRLAIAGDPAVLAVPAMDVAVETNPAIGELLADALTADHWPLDLVKDMTRTLPNASTARASTAAAAIPAPSERCARWHAGAQHSPSQPEQLAVSARPPGGRPGRDRGSRQRLPPARRRPAGHVPARPRHVAEQPVRSPIGAGAAGGRPGRDRRSRHHPPPARRHPACRLRAPAEVITDEHGGRSRVDGQGRRRRPRPRRGRSPAVTSRSS